MVSVSFEFFELSWKPKLFNSPFYVQALVKELGSFDSSLDIDEFTNLDFRVHGSDKNLRLKEY